MCRFMSRTELHLEMIKDQYRKGGSEVVQRLELCGIEVKIDSKHDGSQFWIVISRDIENT